MLLFIFLRLTLWRASYPSSSHTQYGQISLSYKVHFLQQTVQFNLSHASNPYYFFLPYCSPPVWPPCPTSPFPFPATPSVFFSKQVYPLLCNHPFCSNKMAEKKPQTQSFGKEQSASIRCPKNCSSRKWVK